MIRSFADIEKSQLRGMMRRVDSLGRILVPMEYRRELGLEKDVKIEIDILEDGMLVRPLFAGEGGPAFLTARRIDSLGRVNIPVTARRILDIACHDELEMFLLRDGLFIRRKTA
ncbi:MAG: AbrB/MazE/SpoVT family DNA-binding domain-containing protein [Oscillospiraceae bacterium]|jgi:bifunctional DNA-binding transcriptional regulator/antitoxin component of YhaV-PrlF toxin-antitoxin module|nr:AbrB/MazE/SpoVT family DNA-binding domain-containing protein [Oscillospiraceae bacterium]